MATIITDGELLRRALAHLDRSIQERPGTPFMTLLEQTAMQFNLGPAAVEHLNRLFHEEHNKS